MKNLLAILLLQVFAGTMYGQNHVPNGDFEDFVQCPASFSQLARATGWRQYTGGTADYFHACNTGTIVSIPKNNFGYQQPASGKGYAGIYAYQERDYKEYLARHIAPLIKGVRYEVSMSVCLANISAYAINDLSIYLYINGPVSIPSVSGTVNYTPQVFYQSYGILADTQNWVRLSQVFVADSAYNKIIIGSFNAWTTQVKQLVRGGGGGYAYYYIDSVVIKPIDTSYQLPVDTINSPTDTTGNADTVSVSFDEGIIWCAGKSIAVDLFYILDTSFSSENVFTVQLSDSKGDFTNAINIGSITSSFPDRIICTIPRGIPPGSEYRIRVVATSPEYTWLCDKIITITQGPQPVTNKKVTVCPGGTIRLYAVAEGDVSYKWKGPDFFESEMQNPQINNAAANHQGLYTVTVTTNGCVATDTVNVSINCGIVEMPKAFSPNGDGINDILYIRTNSDLEDLDFRIYNRWGQMIFQSNDIKKGWDGTFKGQKLNPEVFGYSITGRFSNGKPLQKMGNVTIIR